MNNIVMLEAILEGLYILMEMCKMPYECKITKCGEAAYVDVFYKPTRSAEHIEIDFVV